MMLKPLYQASRIKRLRATAAEMDERRAQLCVILANMRPMTVRQVFYQATVLGVVDKSEAGYNKVQTDLVYLRRHGFVAYGDLADNTRWQRKPHTFNSIEDAFLDAAHFYRRSLWQDADAYVEIWLEKDALAGVVQPITSAFDVALMVARGYASLSFLHSAAEKIKSVTRPTYIYHLGDFDPSGVNAGEKIEQTLREMAPAADIHFERIAVNADQITSWDLPTRPTKATDTRAKGFGNISVELDAIQPAKLRSLVSDAIERHLPRTQLDYLLSIEADERRQMQEIVGAFAGEQL